jgi:NAD(P)-dependent dehydrogenase (short-subunit alcohol dehydrogenase family)
LIVTYRNDQEFADLKSVADANASRLVGRHVDVTDQGAVQQLIAGIGAEGKGLDVLMNTVGGYVGGMELWELDPRVLDQMLALNLRSGFSLSRAAAKAMLANGGKGAIVNVASKAALARSGAGVAAYAASKAAAVAHDGFRRRRSEGQRSARKLYPAQHHRY